MNRIIPKHIQIETINGVCSSRCIMCTFDSWTRKKKVMSLDTFKLILTKFVPHKDKIELMTIHGCGEPLLDREIAQKIKCAKDMGFRGTGFATNCTELGEKMSLDLLESGVDTVICSIDGINKQTHESIRVRTDFDKVTLNVKNFIQLRNKYNYNTRIMIRFIRMDLNHNQWPEFHGYWTAQLDKTRRDDVVKFDIHNWGNKMENYTSHDINKDMGLSNYICQDVFERMFIYSNGEVALCCGDDNGFFNHGNVIESDPIDIYNNEIFTYYRQMMKDGKILDLKHCENCTIPRSRALKEK